VDNRVELQILAELADLRQRLEALERGRRALDAGRAKAIAAARERALYRQQLVLDFATQDLRAGNPVRGRPVRVARKLRGLLSQSQVRKILRALSSVRDSGASNVSEGGIAQ
jgi:hypothetical protein